MLKSYFGALRDQEDSEGCVGWSFSGAIWTRCNYLADLSNKPQLVVPPSAMFAWWNARKLTGDQNDNTGTYIRNAAKQVGALGICPESSWVSNPPTDVVGGVPRFALQPDVSAFQHAADQRAPLSYHRIGDLVSQRRAQISQALSGGFPVVLGTQVTTSFLALMQHSPLPVPGPDDPIAGGHALQVLYYDENGVYGPNTWQDVAKGIFWGNDGWFALSWDYVNWQYTQDIWAIDCALPANWPTQLAA